MITFGSLSKAEQAEVILSGKCNLCLRREENQTYKNCEDIVSIKIRGCIGSTKFNCPNFPLEMKAYYFPDTY